VNTAVVPDLVVVRPDSDADLEAMITVRAAANPQFPPPRRENLRHNLQSNPDLTYLVARLDGRPVGCGFVDVDAPGAAGADAVVVPDTRRRGVGSALLRELSRVGRAAQKTELEGEVLEADGESRGYFERRGYRRVGGEQAVALELTAHEPVPAEPPPGVRIVSRAERPDVAEGMYDVSREADEDIPGSDHVRTYEAFLAQDVDHPARRPELCFVALAGEEVIGYAILGEYGEEAHHGLTAVKRAWRRRGIATALKRTQIAAAKAHGFRRLVTESEERNEPMRNLNLALGYRPAPSWSTVVLRGPLL
jgi:mycothiol synthase